MIRSSKTSYVHSQSIYVTFANGQGRESGDATIDSGKHLSKVRSFIVSRELVKADMHMKRC